MNKKAEVVRVYLPPDANCLLNVMDHCLRSLNYVNVVVAGKHPAPQWLTWRPPSGTARRASASGMGQHRRGRRSGRRHGCGRRRTDARDAGRRVDSRHHLPDLKIRVVNVVDLMKLQPASEHPHGLSDVAFDALFTRDKPIIFAYHGYPWLIHRLTYRRTNHENLHVRGYKEEGTITTPFDMAVLNSLDRFHLAGDVVDRLPQLGPRPPMSSRPLGPAERTPPLHPQTRRRHAGRSGLALAVDVDGRDKTSCSTSLDVSCRLWSRANWRLAESRSFYWTGGSSRVARRPVTRSIWMR